MNIESKLRALFIPNPPEELGPSDESQYRDGYNTALEDAIDALTAIDTAPTRDAIECAIQVLRQVEAGDGVFVGQCADAIAKLEAIDAAGASNAEFKNFHRLLCERFGYTHDERDWKRDQISLIEHIAAGASEGDVRDDLRKFLDVAAGEGYELDGVDAGDLYLRLFPNAFDDIAKVPK